VGSYLQTRDRALRRRNRRSQEPNRCEVMKMEYRDPPPPLIEALGVWDVSFIIVIGRVKGNFVGPTK